MGGRRDEASTGRALLLDDDARRNRYRTAFAIEGKIGQTNQPGYPGSDAEQYCCVLGKIQPRSRRRIELPFGWHSLGHTATRIRTRQIPDQS